jgi:predicted Zn-dependent protease
MKSIITILLMLCFITQFSHSQSIELDKKIGAENAEIVEAYMGIYPLKELSQYVEDIGNRLVAQLEDPKFEFQFKVVDDPIPNAFALPGGYVYVTRGILSLVTSEDELAGIMGHEIIHATERHSIKQMKKSILPRMLELPGAVVGNVVNEDLGTLLNAPIHTSNTLIMTSYSRKHETESDVLGVELASKAGYDPNALGTILSRLANAIEYITNEKEKKSYFDTHPYTPDRISKIDKTVQKLQWTETDKISADFPSPLSGMTFGENPVKGIFQKNKFLHPELGFAITFPEGWETFNQPTAVGAIHPDRRGALFLGLDDPESTPEELGKAFAQKIHKEHPKSHLTEGHYVLNGNRGYLVTVLDESDSEAMYIHMFWVKMGELMFKMIGLVPNLHEGLLKSSAESFHMITTDERNSITMMEFEIVTARQNDTFESIGKSHGSKIKPEINAFLNGKEPEEVLEKGEQVKIVIEKPYRK